MTSTSTSLSASALAAELAVARAGSAARRGDLDTALRLLRTVDEPTPAALDLLARVHAQRGEFADADAYWEQVQKLDPDNAGAAAGRRTIAAGRARRLLRAGALVAAVACVIGVAGVIGAVWVAPSGGGGAVVAQPVPAQRPQDPAASRAAALDALAGDLAMPGVRLDRGPDTVRVTFDEGLFASSDQLTPAGEQALAELGRRLAGRNLSATIIGHTVTVPGGPTSGGSMVALARALVAARVLADASGLPLTSFTLVSGDQTQAPFQEPTRNRTVTVLIAPPGGR